MPNPLIEKRVGGEDFEVVRYDNGEIAYFVGLNLVDRETFLACLAVAEAGAPTAVSIPVAPWVDSPPGRRAKAAANMVKKAMSR